MSDPTFLAYVIITGLGFLLVLVPLPWHLRSGNVGTCLFMLWTAFASVFAVVNSFSWHKNTRDRVPVWCDISVHLMLSFATAIPASLFCIARQLYAITRVSAIQITAAQRCRDRKIDVVIGLCLPILQMPLQFIVQTRRYDIFEDIGCQPAIANTIPSYPLVLLWPTILCILSACYCLFILRTFIARRFELSKSLSSDFQSGTNPYLRLILLASTIFVLGLPICGYMLYLSLAQPGELVPYSWATIHADFPRVQEVPASVWRYNSNIRMSVEIYRWAVPCCSWVFFLFFGLSEEARKHYKSSYRRVVEASCRRNAAKKPQRPPRYVITARCVSPLHDSVAQTAFAFNRIPHESTASNKPHQLHAYIGYHLQYLRQAYHPFQS
ncbi:STE3-domain-containing protein [Heliocybe sulcata]|uniref:STE3-domain-containing protein n=1 Tax=Heliocybe sulcata TaxID=5364 RepID=A0A5C3N0A2_9AGAM|nr:STE3-domain-containing protein [Heliocybe sulcata]